MFKYLPLLWANLGRRRLRTSLTIASITVAFLLFGLVEALQYALVGGVELAGQDRLMTLHKVSIIQMLPRSYLERVRGLDGVRAACSFNWFGGYYQDERTQVFSYPVLGEQQLFEIYPEIQLPAEQKQAWLSERGGAIIGRALATARGWKVGDTIPLRTGIWFKKDGSNSWDMKISGIFDWKGEAGNTNVLYFHYDYFNEGKTIGRDQIGWMALRLIDANRAAQIAHAVDALFANSSTETKTASEKSFAQGFANQIGNIGTIVSVIVGAVLFTILLVTANTMAQSVRERTNEIAVMKTLGFSSASVTLLVLGEALLITLLGGGLGLLLGNLAVKGVGKAMEQFLPLMVIPPKAYTLGFACMLLLGLLSGVLPCLQAWQLKITDALRRA
jgi:putative ABC transport system permease protein